VIKLEREASIFEREANFVDSGAHVRRVNNEQTKQDTPIFLLVTGAFTQARSRRDNGTFSHPNMREQSSRGV
jgi:hypothetical protein